MGAGPDGLEEVSYLADLEQTVESEALVVEDGDFSLQGDTFQGMATRVVTVGVEGRSWNRRGQGLGDCGQAPPCFAGTRSWQARGKRG